MATDVAGLLGDEAAGLRMALAAESYHQVKEAEALEARRKVKAAVKVEALRGWSRNAGDDDFNLSIEQPAKKAS